MMYWIKQQCIRYRTIQIEPNEAKLPVLITFNISLVTRLPRPLNHSFLSLNFTLPVSSIFLLCFLKYLQFLTTF